MTSFLDWDSQNGPPPYAPDVGSEIRGILNLFPDFFSGHPANANQLSALMQAAQQLESLPSSKPPIGSQSKESHHRLTSLSGKYPVYSALDPDVAFVGRAADRQSTQEIQWLERLGRILLLLHHEGARELSEATQQSIGLFCRNFPKTLSTKLGKPLPATDSAFEHLYVQIQLGAKPYIERRQWQQLELHLTAELAKLPKSMRQRLGEIRAILGELVAIEEHRARRRKSVGTGAPTQAGGSKPTKPRLPVLIHPPKPAIPDVDEENDPGSVSLPPPSTDPDVDDGSTPATLIRPKLTEITEELPEKSLERLAVRGSQLRLTALWSGQSVEALTPAEAKPCMEALLTHEATSDAEEIARILLIVSGLTSHKYANLIAGFSPPFEHDTPAPKLSVAVKEGLLNIEFDVIGHDGFAGLPAGAASLYLTHHVAQRLRLAVPLEQITDNPELLNKICTIDSAEHPLLQGILGSVRTLTNLIRHAVTDRFALHSWRSTMTQALISQTTDIPLAQLIICEDIGVNASAQHYIARDNNQINDTIQKIHHALWADLLPHPAKVLGEGLTGAPWGGIRLENIQTASTILQKAAQTSKIELPESLSIELHNVLVDWTAWLLMLATASRNHSDFDQLTLDQIGLGSHLIVYADKPADPSIFRRVAAIPPFVTNEISRLLHHLIQLRSYCRKFDHRKSERRIAEHIDKVLTSRKPLFFCLTDKDRTEKDEKQATSKETRITKWRSREFINTYLTRDYRLNFARSLFASQTRKHDLLPGILIETQLGHIAGKSPFADDSTLAPIEYARALAAPLTEYLQLCGINTDNPYQAPAHLERALEKPLNLEAILGGIRDTQANDEKMMRNQRGLERGALEEKRVAEAITESIKEHIGIEKGESFPTSITLTQDECIAISRKVLQHIPGDEKRLVSALRQFRNRLRELKSIYKWDIAIPPPIFWHIQSPIRLTKYHLQARDSLDQLRRMIASQFSSLAPEQIHEATVLFLVSYDYLPTVHAAWQLLKEKKPPYAIPSKDCWAIDVPVDTETGQTMAKVLPKPAVYALEAAYRSHIPIPEYGELCRRIHSILPHELRSHPRYSQSTLESIEKLITIARLVTTPPVIADAVSGVQLQRELPAKRISELFSNSGNMNHAPIEEPETPKLRATKKAATQQPFESEVGRLKKILPNKSARGTRPWRGVKTQLTEWEASGCHPNTTLLIQWCQTLMEPTANRKTGGQLALKTVRDYVVDVSTVLVEALGNSNIWSLDEEEILEAIEAVLQSPDNPRENSHKHLNRFFDDMHRAEELPRLQFGNDKNALAAIDASIVTPAEYQLIQNQLTSWAKSKQLTISERRALLQVATYTQISAFSGTRRSELQFARAKDINDTARVIAIRHNQTRTLKTRAAKRLLCYTDTQWENLSLSIQNEEKWLFPEFNSSALRIRPLDCATRALKHATGDNSARLHHYRHTVATNGLSRLFDISDITERLRSSSQLSTSLGHASLKTTLSHYCHSAQTVYADKFSVPIYEIPRKILNYYAACGNKIGPTKGFSLSRLNKRSPVRVAYPEPYKKKALVDIPLRGSTAKNITPLDLIETFEALMRGKSGKSTASSRLDVETHLALFRRLQRLQFETNFETIPHRALNELIQKPDSSIQISTRRNIPKWLLREWKRNTAHLTIEQLSDTAGHLNEHKIGIQWRRRPAAWHCAPEDRQTINKLLTELGLPIEGKFDESQKNTLVLGTTGSSLDASTATISIRCLLQFALSLA